ncbi:hypothetical protein GTA51_09265 [Desulfovibrio aerotolerans]|uniref:Lipoprotein n=1 Tax=Solidesulfovibrio aerotolerans TaxID=295255 RepID=A0A7C9MV57_9BACT|nr:hypothetical protein [Solidesulfovibrio aerotolerans]MYL83314.1 hypothetical protein [Solidesulfovibrio aerotolerans]
MGRYIFLFCLLGCFGLMGCATIQPIMTPQEFEADCRANTVGADAACAGKVCEVYQAVVTDYYDTMEGCYAACKDRAASLETGATGQCLAKIRKARDTCRDFCNRKFYRCNCAK